MLTPTLPTSLWDAIPSINLTAIKRSFPKAGGVGSAPFPQLQTQTLCHSPAFIFRGPAGSLAAALWLSRRLSLPILGSGFPSFLCAVHAGAQAATVLQTLHGSPALRIHL